MLFYQRLILCILIFDIPNYFLHLSSSCNAIPCIPIFQCRLLPKPFSSLFSVLYLVLQFPLSYIICILFLPFRPSIILSMASCSIHSLLRICPLDNSLQYGSFLVSASSTTFQNSDSSSFTASTSPILLEQYLRHSS